MVNKGINRMGISAYFEHPYDAMGLNRLLFSEDWHRYQMSGLRGIFYRFGYTSGDQTDRVIKLCAQLEACNMLGYVIDYTSDRDANGCMPCTQYYRPQEVGHKMKDVGGFELNDPGPTLSVQRGRGLKNKVVCDIGCGNSPMSLIFSQVGAHVHAVTMQPESPESQHPGVVDSPHITLKTNTDYLSYSKANLADNSVDIFLDGCSITHFMNTSDVSHRDACYFVGKEIVRTMKDDGHFIVTSDVTLDEEGNLFEHDGFISMRKMIETYESVGLRVHGPISHIQQFPDRGSLPEDIYDGLFSDPKWRGKPWVAVARLVFRKKKEHEN